METYQLHSFDLLIAPHIFPEGLLTHGFKQESERVVRTRVDPKKWDELLIVGPVQKAANKSFIVKPLSVTFSKSSLPRD